MYGIEGRHGAFASLAGDEKTREILIFEAARHIAAVLD